MNAPDDNRTDTRNPLFTPLIARGLVTSDIAGLHVLGDVIV
jgi:hypothetical protein